MIGENHKGLTQLSNIPNIWYTKEEIRRVVEELSAYRTALRTTSTEELKAELKELNNQLFEEDLERIEDIIKELNSRI